MINAKPKKKLDRRKRAPATRAFVMKRASSGFDAVDCESCQTEPMELVSAQPYIFLGVARLHYRCMSCGAVAETILAPQHQQ